MRLPILVLLGIISGVFTAPGPNIKPINLTRCGKLTEKYFECHVEASCLYGERQRETPMFLRRYYEKFHGKKNLTGDCKTVVVVRLSPAAKLESKFRNTYEDKEIRRFEAEGWIDPAHYKIGVRFNVGQKIVMLSEDDGFTDDDDWIYASHNDGMYPVFAGTYKPVKSSSGATYFTLTAQAEEGPKQCHYPVPYRRQTAEEKHYCWDNRPQPPTTPASPSAALSNTTRLPPAGGATGQQQQAGEHPAAAPAAAADGADAAAAQQNAAAKSGEPAEPATGGLPMFVIVIAIIAALVCVVAVAAGGYYYVRRRRANKEPKTEATQQETTSLIGKEEGEKPASVAPATPAAAAAAAAPAAPPSSGNEEAK